ncbi:MAG: hypothetical protein ABL894_08585 [Hyphomicrobium sp.]
MTDSKSLLIGALLVAVAVLGYVVYERNQRTVKIELPSVSIGRP